MPSTGAKLQEEAISLNNVPIRSGSFDLNLIYMKQKKTNSKSTRKASLLKRLIAFKG